MIAFTLILTEKDGVVINITNPKLHLDINLGDIDRSFLIRNVNVTLKGRQSVLLFFRYHDQIKLQ